jgi:DNA-binding GntR family transcriptional regulator
MEITFKSVNEMVTDRLRESILSGELAEGEYLRQQTLARRYGVSEIVIREALRRLHTEGLVEIQRRKSTRVSQLSAEELNELYELRILLEELITRRAVPNFTVEDLKQAERILSAGEHERDPVRWLALNREFHNTLARPSRQPHLLKFADDLRVKVERYLRMSLGILHGFDVAQHEHREIVDAYKARDPELAARRLGAHLRRTADMIASFLASRGHAHPRPEPQGVPGAGARTGHPAPPAPGMGLGGSDSHPSLSDERRAEK